MNKYIIGDSPAGLFVIIMACVVVFFAVAVWSFYNLIPEYITEEAVIIDNKDGICYIKTDDNFMISTGDTCGNAKDGDIIPVKYDVKMKDRMDAAVRHP